ncbi:glycoside hydrolase family 75 protein [Streptomyces sp. NPDC003247]|uniref:glycoside hydrolase family 75 protein n=1 Tax=Streptomyces sp. NPDC003247 TaxID=3364677 RepID=UPI0036C3025F
MPVQLPHRVRRRAPLTLAAAGLVLLAPTAAPAVARPASDVPRRPAAPREGAVSAADLLARVRNCTRVSRGLYRSDAAAPATIPVCGTEGAVFWTADMDIDCDGRPGTRCNATTDPTFSPATAFTQSDGRYLSAESLPYVVVPAPSTLWDYRAHGVRGGTVAAVVHQGRVQYAVVGDVGPSAIIGEASYATAAALGIRPDPHGGGTASGVTYILFEDSRATPVESHAAAVEVGERLARSFVRGTRDAARRPGATGAGQPLAEDRGAP